jgi:tetratricopeptide (TPR) repeat protein
VENKFIKGGHLGSDYKKAVVETDDFSARYIQETAYRMNLELNFVHNSDLRLGLYATALKGFENAIQAKNDHALAYYYASLCHAALGHPEVSGSYIKKARRYSKLPFWRKYITRFNLPL